GPYNPVRGLRFNAHKVLIDPYARAFQGKVDYRADVFAFKPLQGFEDLVLDDTDDSHGVPKSIVVHDHFDWGDDRAPDVPWVDTVVYELHVRGFTERHPDVPESIRGTYAGVASDAAIAHIRSL